MKRTCDNCGRLAPKQEQMYTLRVELFARVEPLVFDEKDLAHGTSDEMSKLIEQMEALDPQEANDQVYESYSFDLCSVCRNRMHRQLKARRGEAPGQES